MLCECLLYGVCPFLGVSAMRGFTVSTHVREHSQAPVISESTIWISPSLHQEMLLVQSDNETYTSLH